MKTLNSKPEENAPQNEWMTGEEKDNILYDHLLSRTLDFLKKKKRLKISVSQNSYSY